MSIVLDCSSGIKIPNNYPYIESIKKHLTRTVRDWNDTTSVNKHYYEDIHGNILIPRYYPISNIDSTVKINNIACEGEDIEINTNITLRNNRQELSVNHILQNHNGILQLEPGSGKTVISIYSISKVKKKTIILTHKDKLLDNWKKEILSFTDLSNEDIMRLTSKNYEKCLKRPIILCTLQTLVSAVSRKDVEFIKAIKSSNIGYMIIDECHIGTGPEKFSLASLFIHSKKVLGLSATPIRMDGSEDIMYYHLGNVKYFPPEKNETMVPEIRVLKFEHDIFKTRYRYFMYDGKFQVSRYQTYLAKSELYISVISRLINDLYNDHYNILVLNNRVDVLLKIAKALNLPKTEIGIFTPGADKKDILEVSDTTDLDEAFHNKRIVLSTPGMARDGNNRPSLDALIMTNPIANIEQAVGRIQRLLEGKRTPIVYDIVDLDGPIVYSKIKQDKIPYFVRSYYIREEKYKEKGWVIKEKEFTKEQLLSFLK